ncbi:MAG: hypothetical protein ABIT06_06105 [Saprospiraceae bacterium]
MSVKKVRKTRYSTEDGYAYITKRIVLRKAKSAGKIAAANAINTMGYVITVHGDWLVQRNLDGSVQKLSRIEGSQ